MPKQKSLMEAFKETEYQIAGHGPRDIQTLKEAFKNLDGILKVIFTAKAASWKISRRRWLNIWEKNLRYFSRVGQWHSNLLYGSGVTKKD